MSPIQWALPKLCITVMCLLAICSVRASDQEPISLRQAIDAALQQNPSLDATRKKHRAMVQRVRGASALLNPDLQVSPPLFGEGGSDADALFIQPLEVNGNRSTRTKIAKLNAEVSLYAIEKAESLLVREVTQAYWELITRIELARIQEEDVDFSEALLASIQRQVDTGVSPGARLIKAKVELIQTQQLANKAKSQVTHARYALNGLLGRKPDSPIVPEAVFPEDMPSTDFDWKAPNALNQRPEVQAAKANVELARQQVQAIGNQSKPDLAFQLRKGVDTDNVGVALVASIPLCDWGSNRSEKQAAQTEVNVSKKELESVLALVEMEVRLAEQNLKSCSTVLGDFRNGLLENAEKTAELARKGFESGATSYLEVLEAQATLREVKSAYAMAQRDLCQALAQMSWACANNLSEVERS
jgi:outer membrane protein TolC